MDEYIDQENCLPIETVKALPEQGANIKLEETNDNEIMSRLKGVNLFRDLNPCLIKRMKKEFKLKRTYESPINTFYLVFKPLKVCKPSIRDLRLIEKYCRNKFKYKRILIAREIYATSIHYNVLITSATCCFCMHDKIYGNRYKLHVQSAPGIQDIEKIINYILKEANTRPMKEGKDIFNYLRD